MDPKKKKIIDELFPELTPLTNKLEVLGLIPEIPEKGDKGDPGVDYNLTSEDKIEIASMIEVPIVEKIIEKTETVIKEKPVVTKIETVKEVPSKETTETIADKLNSATEPILDRRIIKNLPRIEDFIKELKDPKGKNKLSSEDILNMPAKGPLDQRWHGGGGKANNVTAISPITSTGGVDPEISTSMNTNKLIGRGTAGTGVMEEITLGTGLSLSGTTLNASGGVTSVSNSDGTLTISPTTGAVVASINLAHANTWTGTQTVSKASLGTTTTDGVVVINSTSATSGNQQVSPSFTRTGRGWKTNTTAGSQTVSVRDYVLPVQGTANPSLIFKTQFNINAGSWTDAYSYDTTTAGAGFSINTPKAQSNSTPGTTRLVSFNNTGLYTWLDFNFSGTRKSSFGANSSGELYADATAGNGLIVRISGFVYHYLSSVGLLTNGYGAFSNGVMAGGTTSPTSTLVSTGGTALKVKRITASATLDNTATKWLLDATNASACTGTPTYQCSDYNNETDCTADSSHGGNCTWFGGNDCSVYNYEYGMYGCASQSGCSVDTSSCSGAGDSFSCYAQNDSYGGSCAWNGTPNDCSVFTDETSCLAESGCGWDGSSCSGTYYTYSCDGTYNTGTCSGFYGANCSGSTVTCGQYNNSTDCGLETGCTWSSVLNATLPNIDTCLDRDYWLYNDSSTGADSVIIPYGSQTIDNTSSYTLANYKDGIHISPYITNGNCSTFGDETTCLSYSGCNWDGSACSGTYVVSKNWFVWSRT